MQNDFGWGSPEQRAVKRKVAAHRQRCNTLPPLQRGEAERLVAEFVRTRGGVTICPPAYAAPVFRSA
jgi:hypothetical protein